MCKDKCVGLLVLCVVGLFLPVACFRNNDYRETIKNDPEQILNLSTDEEEVRNIYIHIYIYIYIYCLVN